MSNSTIKDVAIKAGVSTATVSHVINKTRNVSVEVEKRVNNAIKELNFYPNRLVGSLRGKGTFTIGMIIPSIVNETFGRLAEYIQTRLFDLGYNLIVCNTSYSPELEEKALNTFLMKKVDTVIAIPANSHCKKLEEIFQTEIPVILVDRLLEGLRTDAVVVDNYKGQYEMINYLIRMGHKKIGYIDRMIAQSHSIAQKQGYIDALNDNGIEVNKDYILNATGHFYQAGIDAAQVLVHRNKDLTVIACYYDPIAFGVMRGLFDLGYRIPEDISVVGYDNMFFTGATYPALTTIETPVMDMAEATCGILMTRLEEKRVKKKQTTNVQRIILQPKLIIRESVKRLNEPVVGSRLYKKGGFHENDTGRYTR
jgi:LacI family transcriptional regulator